MTSKKNDLAREVVGWNVMLDRAAGVFRIIITYTVVEMMQQR